MSLAKDNVSSALACFPEDQCDRLPLATNNSALVLIQSKYGYGIRLSED